MSSQKTTADNANSAQQAEITASTFIPIIGIGASAGGLEAFEQFFHHVPADSGMTYVLVPHLDPSHASLLTEILQRATKMPVIEALDQIAIQANHVYIIPPNRNMEILHGELQLSLPTAPRGQRLPIDNFFRSLADDQHENAIGIILSGTGTDGTQGARAILGAGGIILAQEPGTAKYDGMPNSAIHAGYVTHILTIDKMWETLQADIRKFVPYPKIPVTPKTDNGIKHVLIQLRAMTGYDFSLYKKSTIRRRIERRQLQHGIENIDLYARYLKENPAEVRLLFKELLINVTSFFRDPEAFAILQQDILPSLCENKTEDSVFRIWIPGCSTGEEAYSIAILLRELMDNMRQEFKVQIYSTDLDDEAIEIARTGLYAPNIVSDITPERLSRFFIKEETGYRIRKDIREMVIFAIQNVIKDPPFTKLDLLCCRNLMIYLEAELQDRLIPIFHFALKPDGVLFLSPSEGIGNHTELFTTINRKWKLYRATPSFASTHLIINRPSDSLQHRSSNSSEKTSRPIKEVNFARVLAQFFAPASVITDLKGEILYIHGDTGKYLCPAPGQPSLNIIDMAREGLSLELRTAIHAAASSGMLTLNREIQVKTNGGYTTVNLNVRPLPDSEGVQRQLLVSFQDIVSPSIKPSRKRTKASELTRIEELEHDLLYLKESYQISIEEQQAFNEELKSSNEELQSINEELQSTNEELETSREELQSVNEELLTVNSELQAKIDQLAEMQNDMKNLLDNVNVGIIFLDRHLIIRRFTREAVRIYPLVASDVGRPLSNIKGVVEIADLLACAQSVLDTLIPYEREMNIGNETWMLVRIQPYSTLDNMIDGVILIFTDISSRIKANVTDEVLILPDGMVNIIHEPFLALDNNLKVIFASDSFYTQFQLEQEDILGHPIYQLSDGQWNNPVVHELLENTLLSKKHTNQSVLEYNLPDMGYLKLLLTTRHIVSKSGVLQMILLIIELG